MLKIRFLRVGKKNAPQFRLVVADKDAPPRGRFLEIIGFYNPYTKQRGVEKERIQYWLSKGAQASDTAHNFLIKTGVITGTKIPVHAKSKKEEVKPAAPATAKADSSAETSAQEKAESPEAAEAPAEEVAKDPAQGLGTEGVPLGSALPTGQAASGGEEAPAQVSE